MGIDVCINREELKSYPVKLVELDHTGNYTKGTYYGNNVYTGAFNVAECVLYLDNLEESGGSASITLDVYIQSYDYITEQWYDAVVFDTITVAAGNSESDKTYHKVATAGIGYYQRAKYVFGGSGIVNNPRFKVGEL